MRQDERLSPHDVPHISSVRGLGNLPLAIKDELQEEKVLAHFGPVTQTAAVALAFTPCEAEGVQQAVGGDALLSYLP